MIEQKFKLKIIVENLEEFELIRKTKSLFLICLQWFVAFVAIILFIIVFQIPTDPLAFTQFIDETSSISISLHVDFITIVSNFFKGFFCFLSLSFGAIAFSIYKFREKRKQLFKIEKTLREILEQK
jgi:hypothetical protein